MQARATLSKLPRVDGPSMYTISENVLFANVSEMHVILTLPEIFQELPEEIDDGTHTQSAIVSFIKSSTILGKARKDTFHSFSMRSYPPQFIFMTIRLQTKFRTKLTWRLYQNFLRDSSPLIHSKKHKAKLSCIGGPL